MLFGTFMDDDGDERRGGLDADNDYEQQHCATDVSSIVVVICWQ